MSEKSAIVVRVSFPTDDLVTFEVHGSTETISRHHAEYIARRILKDEHYPMPESIARALAD
jgi:hypothetical protein